MKRQKNRIERSGNNFRGLMQTSRQLDEERNALTRSAGYSIDVDAFRCPPAYCLNGTPAKCGGGCERHERAKKANQAVNNGKL